MRFLDALRKVLARGATSENFSEMLQLEIDPQINEKREKFRTILEGCLSQEEKKTEEHKSRLMANLLEASNAESFAETVLERNKINIVEDVKGRLDDPILRIFADDVSSQLSCSRK
jgi:hypothetical protein